MSKGKKKKTPTASKVSFRQAVDHVAELSLKEGLGAVKGADRDKIRVRNLKKLNGSVDIDSALLESEPDSARWDYVIGHDDKAYFVEIHSADTSNVKEVIKKLDWLKNWLKTSATELDQIKADKPYHWIASRRVHILPNSREYKLCVSQGVAPKEMMQL